MITFTVTPSDLAERLAKKGKRILQAAKMGMVDGMRDFESRILKTQMSGPTSGSSLSVRTGFLRRSWFIEKTDMWDYGFVVRLGTRAPYAKIHQYGGPIKHPGGTAYFVSKGGAVWVSNKTASLFNLPRTKPHIINIPKRLHINEEFKTLGMKMIGWGMNRRMKEVVSA